MTKIDQLHSRLMSSFDLEGLEIPTVFVKIYSQNETMPPEVEDCYSDDESIMSCQAARHAAGGNPVLLTIDNVGCVAAAISLGLVDQNRAEPLEGKRIYTCVMHERTDLSPDWKPPSPRDFTQGRVYACRDAGMDDFCLFEDDSGRFKDVATAARAVSQMTAIQPPTTRAVFFYYPGFEFEVRPDVVIMAVRPVELTRLIQGYAYLTGERIRGDMGPVRAVNSDLIARPYLTGEINVTTYCLGARLLAKWEADLMGVGIPMARYETLVRGMEESRKGYPFPQYPGAGEKNTRKMA